MPYCIGKTWLSTESWVLTEYFTLLLTMVNIKQPFELNKFRVWVIKKRISKSFIYFFSGCSEQ